jgi:hypothetical protein
MENSSEKDLLRDDSERPVQEGLLGSVPYRLSPVNLTDRLTGESCISYTIINVDGCA